MRSFYNFKLANSRRAFLMNNSYDADEILQELNSALRTEVLLDMEKDLVKQIPFFNGKAPHLIADIVTNLEPVFFHEGDYIIKKGFQADEMYFLIHGIVAVYYGDVQAAIITAGNFFGEIGCIIGGDTTSDVKAMTRCEL